MADFGLSRITQENIYESRGTTAIPVRWCAPEVISNNRYTSKSDSWAMGITLYEIITRGRVPYGGMKNAEVVVGVVDEGYRPDDCPSSLWKLMLRCWMEKAEDRPTLKEISNTIGKILEDKDFSDGDTSM